MVEVKMRRGKRKTSTWSQGLTLNAEGLTFKDVARAQLRLINSNRRRLKKCSATAKSSGEPCGQTAMENGKCRFHGGKTPKGDQWHVTQANVSGHKTSMSRFDQKVAKADRNAKANRQRLRLATDAERAAYDKWQKDHLPGSAERRSARRLDRRIAQETKHLLTEIREYPKSPEVEELECRIAELKADKARRAALAEGFNQGVFL